MASSRPKGKRGELELVHAANRAGFPAKRTAPMQAGLSTTWPDVLIEIPDGQIRAECKYRESLPEWLWKYLEGMDILHLRKNRKDALVVLRESDYFALLQALYPKIRGNKIDLLITDEVKP